MMFGLYGRLGYVLPHKTAFGRRPATRFLAIAAGPIEPPTCAAISGASHRAERPMKLVSIPANPVPDNVVTGMLKTPDGVGLRFARWEPPAGRRGTVCIFPGRTEWIEKYFETVRDLRARGFAVAVLDWRGQGLSDRCVRRPSQGLCAELFRLRRRSRDLHARDRAAGLSAAVLCARPFHGRDRADPRSLPRPPLVRSHGAERADDCGGGGEIHGDRRNGCACRCGWAASAARMCRDAIPACSICARSPATS